MAIAPVSTPGMPSATPSPTGYALNPFAAGGIPATRPLAQQAAQANALRSYAPQAQQYAGNPFAASMPAPRMAAHLSQPIPLDPYLLQAYHQMRTDPMAKQYQQTVPDVDRLWRMNPNSPMFQAGYKHNPYVLQLADQLRPKAPVYDDTNWWQAPSSGGG